MVRYYSKKKIEKLKGNINLMFLGDDGQLWFSAEYCNFQLKEKDKEIERLNKEIKRLKQKLLVGKKANILFFDEVGVDKE